MIPNSYINASRNAAAWPHEIKPGQLWSDANGYRNRIVLVLAIEDDRAICQGLLTSKISKVRLEQFGRGKLGYFYCGKLVDASEMYLKYALSK